MLQENFTQEITSCTITMVNLIKKVTQNLKSLLDATQTILMNSTYLKLQEGS